MDTLDKVIEGCKAGNEAMQAELYKRYSPRFYALCRRYASDDDIAQDILIEGFLSVFNDISNYRGEGSFEGWMQTIFIRKAVRHFRSNRRRQEMFVAPDKEDIPYSSVDLDKSIDVREAMVAALRHLSEKERKTFNLVAIEEYTMADAAEVLGLPESTVKSQYYRAQLIIKKKLSRILGRHYLKY